MNCSLRLAGSLFLVAMAATSAVQAKPDQCMTTDDGSYPCDFHSTGEGGGFTIKAPGMPTYSLDMVAPGIAAGYANFGARSVPLPGRFKRVPGPNGCWLNDSTGVRICAK